MENIIQSLLESYNENCTKFKPCEQDILQSWIDRLMEQGNEEECSTRTEYAGFLTHIMKKGELHYPFLTAPPCSGINLLPLTEYFLGCKEHKSPSCPQPPPNRDTKIDSCYSSSHTHVPKSSSMAEESFSSNIPSPSPYCPDEVFKSAGSSSVKQVQRSNIGQCPSLSSSVQCPDRQHSRSAVMPCSFEDPETPPVSPQVCSQGPHTQFSTRKSSERFLLTPQNSFCPQSSQHVTLPESCITPYPSPPQSPLSRTRTRTHESSCQPCSPKLQQSFKKSPYPTLPQVPYQRSCNVADFQSQYPENFHLQHSLASRETSVPFSQHMHAESTPQLLRSFQHSCPTDYPHSPVLKSSPKSSTCPPRFSYPKSPLKSEASAYSVCASTPVSQMSSYQSPSEAFSPESFSFSEDESQSYCPAESRDDFENCSAGSVLDSTPFVREKKRHEGIDVSVINASKKSMKSTLMEIPVKGIENTCKINELVDSITDDTILKDFMYQVAPFTRDKIKTMEFVVQSAIADFRNLVEKILESRKQDIGDGLASEQMSISGKYDIAIRQKRAAKQSIKNAVLKILPEFDFHIYEKEGDAYLRMLMDKHTRRMSAKEKSDKWQNEALMRMELIVSEANRIERKNDSLKKDLENMEHVNKTAAEGCSSDDFQAANENLEEKIMDLRNKLLENDEVIQSLMDEDKRRRRERAPLYQP